jgi:uncharacterized protein
MAWLVRDGAVLGPAEVAVTRADRRRGLLGRDRIEGALVLRPCRQVHTIGMRRAIDVAWCDVRGRVLGTTTLPRMRISRWEIRAGFVIEAEAGTLARWGVRRGEVLELVDEVPDGH